MPTLKSLLYKHGYPLAIVWWFFRRPTTAGVRLIIEFEDQVLLIRHTYGPQFYTVPGGGLHKDESIVQAAIRETKEEVGIDINNVTVIDSVFYTKEFKKDTIHICRATSTGRKIKIDRSELRSAEWFKKDALPDYISPVLEPYIK